MTNERRIYLIFHNCDWRPQLKILLSFEVWMAVAQWLRCCAANRKVAGSIPGIFTGSFHWHNPSDRTMALGSTQPLTEMSTRSISWEWRRPVRKADNLTNHPLPFSWNLKTSTSWNPLCYFRPVTGLLLCHKSEGRWFDPSWCHWNISLI